MSRDQAVRQPLKYNRHVDRLSWLHCRRGWCEAFVRSTLTLTGGKIPTPADLCGRCGREGLVRISINGAYASGQPGGNAG